ncbi:MAG: hypothetical protein JSR21_07995 [Proteobacteria bacterium]|nr:hypothetical protein [Pseudomonadota bacterium]
MAKGQKRSNREPKKPKAKKVAVTPGAAALPNRGIIAPASAQKRKSEQAG